jgi:hypothetical protein
VHADLAVVGPVSGSFLNYKDLAGVGDINSDGRGDLVARDFDGILHKWYGSASGDLVHSGTMGGGWNNYSDLTGMGDIGDGCAGDILGRRYDSALLRWTGTGGGNFKPPQLAIGFFTLSYDPA